MNELQAFLDKNTAGELIFIFITYFSLGYWLAFITKNFHDLAEQYRLLFYLFVLPMAFTLGMGMIQISLQNTISALLFFSGFMIRFFVVKR